MDDLTPLLQRAAEHAASYRRSLPERPVRPELDVDALADAFGGSLPSDPPRPPRCSMSAWRGRRFMRISVSNYATSEADVDRSVETIVGIAGGFQPAVSG